MLEQLTLSNTQCEESNTHQRLSSTIENIRIVELFFIRHSTPKEMNQFLEGEIGEKKHYVCQYSRCNNRCDGHCDVRSSGCYIDRYYDLYSGHTTGSYYVTGGDYVGDACEKCGCGFLGFGGYYGYGYRCEKCGHLYCYSCCFK